jgi:hypothetical protein
MQNARRFNPLDPLGLLPTISFPFQTPGVSTTVTGLEVTSTSTGQPSQTSAATATTSSAPAATTSPITSTSISTAILTLIEGLFANQTTEALDVSLNNTANALIKGVIAQSGIAEFYTLHIRVICSGSLSNGEFVNRNCSSYRSLTHCKSRSHFLSPKRPPTNLSPKTSPTLLQPSRHPSWSLQLMSLSPSSVNSAPLL